MYSNERLQGEDPYNVKEYAEDEEVCVECRDGLALYGRELCQACFDAEHGPDNDRDLDPERSGGYSFDIQALEDTQC